MDALAETDALWSQASTDDLRRIADLARRLFAAPAVLLLSAGAEGDRLRFASGDPDAAAEDAGFDAPLILDDGPNGGRRLGTVRVLGEGERTADDRAALADLAACLSSLIESRHAASFARRDDASPAPQPMPAFVPDPVGETSATQTNIAMAPREDETSEATSASVHILLADDLDLNRKLISDMLSIEGHAVDSVADGAAAVKAAGEHSYDIILMDMIMPVMDGMAATRAIRAMPAPACDVPIVALTAHSLPEQLDNCLKAGVDAILTKPMSVAALTDAVSTWTRRGRRAA